MKQALNKIYLLSFFCLAGLAIKAQDGSPVKTTTDITIDKVGNAVCEFKTKYSAMYWDIFLKTVGSNTSILKNQLINPIADHCKSLSGKPVSIAPFFNYKLTDVDTFSSFMTSLGSSNIDLIILQDGIGVFHCDLESLESYFAAANKSLYEIGDFKGAFWADIETFKFTDTVTETMNPESIEVIVKKLSIVAPHVSNIVTFQYYNDMCAKNPNGKLAEKLRNDYIKYLK